MAVTALKSSALSVPMVTHLWCPPLAQSISRQFPVSKSIDCTSNHCFSTFIVRYLLLADALPGI